MPEFKDFRLGNILEIRSAKAINPAKDKIVRNGKYRFITRTAQNNGVTDYIDFDEQYLSPANTISFGVDTVSFFYQDKPYYTGIKVKVLYPRGFELTENIALYLLVGLRKAVTGFGWGTIYKSMDLDNKLLCLPVKTENGIPIIDTDCKYHKDGYIPDFEYMERYIAELEQERIVELEQYLIVTGLNDYTLTDEDKAVLSLIKSSRGNEITYSKDVGTVRFEEFELGKLFVKIDIVKIKLQKSNCPSEAKEGFEIPARTATTTNQGLSCYVPRDSCTVLNNKISVSANGDFAAFWHDSEFTILQDSYALGGNGYELTSGIALYSIACMYRTLGNRYNWTNKSGWNKIRNEVIELPVIDEIDQTHKYHKDGYIPDFEYMERYIRSMQKVVIVDVVKYKDEVIEKTKSIVGV